MPFIRGTILRILPLAAVIFAALSAPAQSGNAGTVRGTVTDPIRRRHSQRDSPPDQRRSADSTGPSSTDATRPVRLLQRPLQSLPDRRLRQGLCAVEPECRDSLVGGNQPQTDSPGCRRQPDRHRRSQRRPDRERSHLPHRRGPRPVHQGAAGEPVFYAQLAGHAHHPRRCGRLQRPLPRPRRPRLQLVLRRRPVDHRPAEQGLLQPDSVELDSIHRSDQRRAAGRVRRQDQPGDRGHHALRAGRHQAHRQHQRLLWRLRLGDGRLRPGLWRQEAGAISSRPTA